MNLKISWIEKENSCSGSCKPPKCRYYKHLEVLWNLKRNCQTLDDVSLPVLPPLSPSPTDLIRNPFRTNPLCQILAMKRMIIYLYNQALKKLARKQTLAHKKASSAKRSKIQLNFDPLGSFLIENTKKNVT